jgi:hypothetical protein
VGGLGAPEVIIIALVPMMALPAWGIVDAALRPDASWQAAGQSKIVWVIIQLFLWTLGSVVYFAAIRPKLKAVR